MRPKLLIEPHYFGSLEYYGLLLRSEELILEVCQHFTKQTYKNRCEVLSPQGRKSLIVPVHFTNRMPLKEVKIDYSQSWTKAHLGMLQAAYGKAAYYDYYYPEIEPVIFAKPVFLLDLVLDSMSLILKMLQVKNTWELTANFTKSVPEEIFDARETILAKKSFRNRQFYKEVSYFQNFGGNFESNLSVLDCLMNTGPEFSKIIQESSIKE